MAYTINHHRLFEKEILRMPKQYQQRAYKILTQLKTNPNKLPTNTAPLTGYKGVYRTRLGDTRLIYQINHRQKAILVLGINFRGNAYKVIRRMLC